MACRFCPGAVHVSLYVDEDGHLLTPLTKLEHLRELKLLGGCAISVQSPLLLAERSLVLVVPSAHTTL
jgi:hypothetical protein